MHRAGKNLKTILQRYCLSLHTGSSSQTLLRTLFPDNLSMDNKKKNISPLQGRNNYDIELNSFFEKHATEIFRMANIINREISD